MERPVLSCLLVFGLISSAGNLLCANAAGELSLGDTIEVEVEEAPHGLKQTEPIEKISKRPTPLAVAQNNQTAPASMPAAAPREVVWRSSVGHDATRLLINLPTPGILGHREIALQIRARYFPDDLDVPDELLLRWGPAFRLGMGLFNRVELGIEAVSGLSTLDHASLYVRGLVLEEGRYSPAIGVGAFDLLADEAPNEDASFPVVSVGDYLEKDKTNNSLYLVLAKRIPAISGLPLAGRGYLGIGRGRFRGRCGIDADFNGMFAGGELTYAQVRFMAEIVGWSANAGIGTRLAPIKAGQNEISIDFTLAGKYLTNIRRYFWEMNRQRPALAAQVELIMRRAQSSQERFDRAEGDMIPAPAVAGVIATPLVQPKTVVAAADEFLIEDEIVSASDAIIAEPVVGQAPAVESPDRAPTSGPPAKGFDEFRKCGIGLGNIPFTFDSEIIGRAGAVGAHATNGQEVIVRGRHEEGAEFAAYRVKAGSCVANYLGMIRILGSMSEDSCRGVVKLMVEPITRGDVLYSYNSLRQDFEDQRQAEGDEVPVRARVRCIPGDRHWLYGSRAVIQLDAGRDKGVLYGQRLQVSLPGYSGKKTHGHVIRVDDESCFLKIDKIYQVVQVGDEIESLSGPGGESPLSPR